MVSELAVLRARVAFWCLRRTAECGNLTDEELARRIGQDMADLYEWRLGEYSPRQRKRFVEELPKALLKFLEAEKIDMKAGL
jgi:hypothetical protein